METRASIVKLFDASTLLEKQTNLEEGLREVAEKTAKILGAQRCSIMLLEQEAEPADKSISKGYLRVFAHHGSLPEAAYREMTKLNEGIAGYVAATGEPLLIKDITQSRFLSAARHLDEPNKSLISAPILLDNQAIGTINVSNPTNKQAFEEDDLELLNIFALFVGKSICISQLQSILKSRLLEIAVARDLAPTNLETTAISPDPSRLAKIVAKSIFRELTDAGFGTNQIIQIATDVLQQLQDNLYKYKKRWSRDRPN